MAALFDDIAELQYESSIPYPLPDVEFTSRPVGNSIIGKTSTTPSPVQAAAIQMIEKQIKKNNFERSIVLNSFLRNDRVIDHFVLPQSAHAKFNIDREDRSIAFKLFDLHYKWPSVNADVHLDVQSRYSSSNTEVASQVPLPLDGQFAVSTRLAEFWYSSVKETYLADGRASERLKEKLDESVSVSELKKEFSLHYLSFMAAFAQKLRHQSIGQFRLLQNGRFNLQFQLEICDRFLIAPDRALAFLQMVSEETLRNLKSGFQLRGRWGQLVVVEGSNLTIELNPV